MGILQIIIHLWGDYILQSDWMANNKTKSSFACLMHAGTYSAGFLLLKPSLAAFLVIVGTHFFIDRFRLARYLCYAKNFLAPEREIWKYPQRNIHPEMLDDFQEKYKWSNCSATGYPSETPPFMAVWLMIVCDNTLHLTINYLALRFL